MNLNIMNRLIGMLSVLILLLFGLPDAWAGAGDKTGALKCEAYYLLTDESSSPTPGMQEVRINFVIENISKETLTVATTGMGRAVVTKPNGDVEILYHYFPQRTKSKSEIVRSVIEFSPALLAPGESVVLFKKTTIPVAKKHTITVRYDVDEATARRYGFAECHFRVVAVDGHPYE